VRRTARWAYATTRVRALRGALLGPDLAARLRAAREPAAIAAALRDAGVPDPSPAAAFEAVHRRLAARYARVARDVPEGADVVLALARLHELENLKLVWRACTRARPPAAWQALWRPLGALAALEREAWLDARTPDDVARLAAGTPYAALAEVLARAHRDDPLAGELAIDRFGTRALRAAAAALPEREATARALALSVAEERDAELARRAAAYGLDAPAGAPPPATLALRRARARACRRAFLRAPLSLAPAIALLLLEEAQARALLALVEAAGAAAAAAAADDMPLAEALAGSVMEA
jgi:vacuolar-type H+-ATPase subunit C/Vma6